MKLKKILIWGTIIIGVFLVIAILNDDSTPTTALVNNTPVDTTPTDKTLLVSPPANCKIVFTSDLHSVGIGEQGSELYCMDLNGDNLIRLTNNNFFEFHADVSPSKKEIVTVTHFEEGTDTSGELDSNSELVTWNFNGEIIKRLTNNNRAESVPHWSPDGQTITFFAGSSIGNLNIYTINRDGTNEKKLTSGGVDVDPSYSPSGEIIFSRGSKIMIMESDGSNLRILVELEINPEDPIFLDANTIMFEAHTESTKNFGIGDFDIFLINKDGTNLRDISNNEMVDALPQPIDNKITFWRIDENTAGTQMMIMDKDGSNKKSLISQISNSQMPTGVQ